MIAWPELTLISPPEPAWGFTGKTYKAAASYPFASTSGASHAVSPQPSHALPPHMQQGTNGRMHGVASPPLSSQTSHLSRTSSSQGPATLASSMATSGPSSEDGLGKSGISTPVPSSSTSASGVPTPGSAQMLPIQHHQPPGGGPQVTALHGMPGRPHMVPQGYVLHPQAGQQYPGFPYVPGTHQQGPGHIQSPGGQHPHMIHQQVQSQQMQGHQIPGQPAAQFVMGPNGPIFGQFFPPGAVPAMLSPQMMGQMAHGRKFRSKGRVKKVKSPLMHASGHQKRLCSQCTYHSKPEYADRIARWLLGSLIRYSILCKGRQPCIIITCKCRSNKGCRCLPLSRCSSSPVSRSRIHDGTASHIS